MYVYLIVFQIGKVLLMHSSCKKFSFKLDVRIVCVVEQNCDTGKHMYCFAHAKEMKCSDGAKWESIINEMK